MALNVLSCGRFVKTSNVRGCADQTRDDRYNQRLFCFYSPSFLINAVAPICHTCRPRRMSQSPPAPPSLEVLRKEIDSIDEQMHRLLMARGDIIDRLIQVKQTQEVG